jgi:phage replication O-like protein O
MLARVGVLLMASPQLENGFTPLAHELFQAFYCCKMTEYERVVVMHLWRKTYGWGKKSDWISNSQFSEETGVPRPHVTRTLTSLKSKMVISASGKKLSVNKNYEEWLIEWRKLPVQVTPIVTSSGNRVTSSGNEKLPDEVPTKESKETTTKEASNKVMNLENQNIIPELIKLFEAVDPKNKTYYKNTSQREACQFLLDQYGLELVTKVVAVLPKTNQMEFFPVITTPCQLRDKWVQLQNAITRKKNETKSSPVAF